MKRVRASRGCKVCTEVFRQSQVKSSMFPRFMYVGHKLCSMPVADCCLIFLNLTVYLYAVLFVLTQKIPVQKH